MTSTESQKRILVIDDNAEVRLLLITILGRRGYEVIPAVNGEEGRRAFELFGPDLVILDLMMPKVDGVTFLRSIENQKRDVPVPIIVVSAHLQTDPEQVLALGATTLLPKPFDIDHLVQLIQSLI